MTLTTELAPNTRAHKIREFLKRKPKRSAELHFRAVGGIDEPARQLGTWMAEEVSPALQVDVLSALDAFAEDRSGTVKGELTFVADDGTVLAVLAVERRASSPNVPDSLSSVSVDGSKESQVVQAQAFAQVCMQQLIRSNALVLEQSVKLSQHSADVAAMLAQRLADSEVRYAELRASVDERIAEAVDAALEGASGETGGGNVRELVAALEPHLKDGMQLVKMAMLAKSQALRAVPSPAIPSAG